MNLSRLIERHAAFQPDRVALECAGDQMSYRVFWERIQAMSRDLAAVRGIGRGDRVAFLGYNEPAVLVLLFALARLGAMLVPLNWRLAPPELVAVLDHAGARLLVSGEGWADAGRALAAQRPGLALAEAAAMGRVTVGQGEQGGVGEPGAAGADADPVLMVYTSGTTGRPKGVVHTQSALIWNAINATDAQAIGPEDHVLCVLPLFHVGGLCIQTIPALHAGARVSLHARFDPGAWLAAVRSHRPTLSLLVPAVMKALTEHPDWPSADLSSLRELPAGSSVVPGHLLRAFLERGVALTQVYGATETGPVSIYLKARHARAKAGSAGQCGLHTAVRLVGEDGADVAPGEVGEIWVSGPNVMSGYWQDPHNPAFQDGWFRSGDLARCDAEGFYWVVGRSKDMIISGGENIYPAELENLLAACPQIAEAAVFGEADPRWGEVAVCAVVLQGDARLDAAGVLALFEGRLARYKHPRRVVFVDALPKNALGKVQKGALREQVGAALRSAGGTQGRGSGV